VSHDPAAVDPVIEPVFQIGKTDRIASAGSCFAQHISRALVKSGFDYLVTEKGPLSAAAENENFGVFSARYGNIYTIRQLLQLFQRAYGLFEPATRSWTHGNGKCLDPFRPQIQGKGFPDPQAVGSDADAHLGAVRQMFETCSVLIFTLGLTEGWASRRDGAVVPLAPGTVGVEDPDFGFENFSVSGMIEDLETFISKLRTVNPSARVLLTVSPVPLIATYESRHVLVSTVYSKSALRVVADAVSRNLQAVDYFPSYEIITGPQSRGRFFGDDLRTVTAEGVDAVMDVFSRHYLSDRLVEAKPRDVPVTVDMERITSEYEIVCDEEAIDD
jgi:hypothetical protein